MALTHWKWRIVIALVIIALGLFLFCPKAFSQDPVRGEYLAKSWCISCHNIDPGDMTLRSEVVPSFASIAARSETNQSSLEAFLRSKHPRMPVGEITPKEIRDVASFIVSLKPKRGIK